MGYWKSKVLPKFNKVFGKDSAKKAAATEACKSFDESKEAITKEFEDKKEELHPKVIEIIEASSVEIKTLVKVPKEGGIKKHSVKVQEFLNDLVKIEFPGSKVVCEASSNYGPTLVSGPIIFVFEKVSTFVVTEEKPREVEVATPEAAAETEEVAAAETTAEEITVEETKTVTEKENPVEDVAAAAEPEKPTTNEPQVEETPKA